MSAPLTNLRAIRDRLAAVQNIRKVTRAMEMIASARLHKAQVKATQIRPYLLAMHELLSHILQSSDISRKKGSSSRMRVVIIGSDRGLCGAYNNAVFRAAESFLEGFDPERIDLILFGRKALQHFRKKKWPIVKEVVDWGGKLSFSKISELSNEWLTSFSSDEVGEIWIAYTHFESILKRKVLVEKFLPIDSPEGPEKRVEYLFETPAEQIYDELVPRYLSSKVQSVLNESYASELAARAIAMKGASRNASDKIEELTQLRNKVRQAEITKEMIEITSGAQR